MSAVTVPKKVLVALLTIAVLLAGVIAIQPSEFRVTRATTVAAPAPVVFAQVNDFHKWDAWNPFGKLDPAARKTYEGPPSGAGAVYAWSGNSQVGEGRMTMVESHPSDRIRIKLEFFKPMAGTGTAEFAFRPDGDRTTVAWTMTGTNNFIAKAIGLVVSMDRMIGGQFEKGLADMKAVAEAAARP